MSIEEVSRGIFVSEVAGYLWLDSGGGGYVAEVLLVELYTVCYTYLGR